MSVVQGRAPIRIGLLGEERLWPPPRDPASTGATAGPAFSPHEGHRRFLRLPVWHPIDQLAEALAVVAGLARTPDRHAVPADFPDAAVKI